MSVNTLTFHISQSSSIKILEEESFASQGPKDS